MKLKIRSIMAVLLSCLLLVSFMACAKDEPPVTDDSQSEAPDTSDNVTPTPPDVDDGNKDNGDEGNDEGNDEGDNEVKPVPKTTVYLKSGTNGVSLLGVRGVASQEGIFCDWAGSGFEFNVDLPQAGDIGFFLSVTGECCFRVFVDGTAHSNTDGTPYYKVNEESLAMKIENVASGKHLISVVRCDDGTAGTALFNNAVIPGTHVTTLAEKDLYVEFVGDDIMLGKGLNGTTDGYDAMLAFAYKTATALNAEYSITALAGQGVVAGDLSFDTSYELASPKHQPNMTYDFAKQADIVVVALGTNDAIAGETENFRQKYYELIYSIRQKNGSDCKVYCVYSGNEGVSADIQAACASIGGEAAGFYAVEWTGVTGTSYPTEQQQTDFAGILIARINATKDNEIVAQPTMGGVGVVIKWKNGVVTE